MRQAVRKSLLLFISLNLFLIGCQDPPDMAFEHDKKGLYSAQFSNQGQFLVISTVEKSAQLWDFENDQHLHTWSHQANQSSDLSTVAISGNGKLAVTAVENAMAVWNVKTGESMGYWNLPSIITHLKLSKSGKYALVAYVDRSVQLIDVVDGRSVWKAIHNGYIESIDLSADGSLALVGCDDHTTTLWDIEDSERLHLWEEKSRIRYVALSPKSTYAMVSTPLQSIKLYDIKTGELVHNLKISKFISDLFTREVINVSSATFSDDERLLVTGAPPRHVYVWDVREGHLLTKHVIPKKEAWKPTSAIVYATAIRENGKELLAEASDGFGYLWELPELSEE